MSNRLQNNKIPNRVVFLTTIALLLIGLLGLTALQYTLPPSFKSVMIFDHRGLAFYARHLGIHVGSCTVPQFAMYFRLILTGLVVVHIMSAKSALSINPVRKKNVFVIVVLTNIFIAVVYPPAQSNDTFNYTALARIYAYYHMNPYIHSTAELVAVHDSIVPFLNRVYTSMYGPLWTFISSGVAITLRGAGLFSQILAYKLLEGAAVVAAAEAGYRYCARRQLEYGLPALIAIGLNPLSLLEGPGNGHNDIFMTSLCMISLYLFDIGARRSSCLLIGISAAIKFVPFILLPWIALEDFRRRPKISIFNAAVGLGSIFLPIIILMLPFWDHGAALSGITSRMQNARESLMPKGGVDNVLPAPHHPIQQLLGVLHTQQNLIILYATLTAILVFRDKLAPLDLYQKAVNFLTDPGCYPAWIIAWVIFAIVERDVIHTQWFSWYFTWAIFPAACIWTKKGNPLFIAIMGLALVDTLFYTVLDT